MKQHTAIHKSRFAKAVATAVAFASVFCAVFSLSACGGGEEEVQQKPALKHDPVTLEVEGKEGTYQWHNFVDGKCEYCDETTIFRQEPLSGEDILTTQVDEAHRGTVTSFTYETRSYYTERIHADKLEEGEQLWVTKKANIYLPAGYNAEDKNTRYNVLYLMHGNGLNENYWFAQGEKGDNYNEFTPDNNAYTGGYGTENVLDHLMMDGRAAKTIIVTPTFYSPYTPEEGDTRDFTVDRSDLAITEEWWQELKNELMPYVATHYNTYADISADMTAEEMEAEFIANRDHQGYAGLSMGGMTSYASIWRKCTDYISYIGTFSGGGTATKEILDEVIETKNTEFKDYNLNYWFVGAGTSEEPETFFDIYVRFRKEVNGLTPGSDIKNGDNCEFCVTNGTAHNYATWITDLYNSMLVFFQK